MTLLDRRHIYRLFGSTFDNVIVPPIVIDPPPVTPPDPNPPPVVRGNYGQQRSAYVHALNAARQETHGHPVNIISADPTKVRIDSISGNIVLFTVLDESAIIVLNGDVGGVAVPTILATGISTPVAVSGLVGQWQSDIGVTTSGSEVTAIADQTGNNNITKIDATGPTLVSNVINGLPAIKSTATVTRLSHAITQLNNKSSYTLVLVRSPYDQAAPSGIQLAMSLDDGVGPALSLGQGDAGDYRVGGFWNGAFKNTNGLYRGSGTVNLFDIIVVVRNGATVTFYKNGAPLVSSFAGSASAIANPSLYLGGDRAGNSARGMWVQAQLYDHALTATEVKTLSIVLGAKYNIATYDVSGTLIDRTGWIVTAWHNYGSPYETSKAIDGNLSTNFFSAAIPGAGDWIAVDMGSAQTVGGVQTDNTRAGGTNALPMTGNIQYSDNGSSWTNIGSWNNGTIGGVEISTSWTPSTHRYWRLLATSGTPLGDWWGIGELYFYSDRAP